MAVGENRGTRGSGVEEEILRQKAETLGRIGHRAECAVEAAWRAYRAWRAGAPGGESYPECRAEAARWLWYLEVQREAVGLVHHQLLRRLLKLPPESDGGGAG